jgi:acetyl-CoA carboxylase biotin carboxyl carrier protein
MWQDKLKEIIYILENSEINEIDINFWGRKFRVVKSPGVNVIDDESVKNFSDFSEQVEKTDTKPHSAENSPVSTNQEILSPMPGTFYAAPSPDAEVFVKEGVAIKKGDTLCIIEAMKIMNEIEAEQSGVISEILIKNGEPVEYNQPLFKIDPS